MIVLDASVVVELLTNGALADSIRKELARRDESFLVPYLIDLEVVSALRKMAAGRRIDPHFSGQFLEGLMALPAERYSHTPLISRIWELRHNFTAYDAAYIALAEATTPCSTLAMRSCGWATEPAWCCFTDNCRVALGGEIRVIRPRGA